VLWQTRLAMFPAVHKSVAKKIPASAGTYALDKLVNVFDVLLHPQVSYSTWGVAYMNPG
jgi:hypothetical protein